MNISQGYMALTNKKKIIYNRENVAKVEIWKKEINEAMKNQ